MAAFQDWCEQWARECFRALKPGGHIVAFGGTRTWHRLAAAIEDVGFELRDSIAWLYGSGFPKSLDVSKAIDNARMVGPGITTAATDAARQWQGWGTALKPAFEPIVVARKPLPGTVAATVLEHGTGALNIDGCRVAYRWPSNVLLTHVAAVDEYGRPVGDACAGGCVLGCPVAELDGQSVPTTSGTLAPHHRRTTAGGNGETHGAMAGALGESYGDTGAASKFFPAFRWEAKAPTSERPQANGVSHPTVKPVALMRWLVRLVTPKGGVVLDPFLGSGTTAHACRAEKFQCIGIEADESYISLIRARLDGATNDAQSRRSRHARGQKTEQADLFGPG
jgi:site-specific DNA-methyltransferase (adenine-specific)